MTLEQTIREQGTISLTAEPKERVFSVDEYSDDNEVNVMKTRTVHKTNSCTHCGYTDHSAFERREKCPAWGKKCNNCQTLHHFKSMCLKPKRNKPMQKRNSVNFAEVLFIGEMTSSNQLPIRIKIEGSKSFHELKVFPDTGANIV